MRPTPDQLLEQLSRLKATPLPDGFEAALHERLSAAANEQAGAVVLPLRRPRRKATLVLIAALSVPLAAAAASGVLSGYWRGEPRRGTPSEDDAGRAEAQAAKKVGARVNAAPAPATPLEVERPASSSDAPAVGVSTQSGPERAQRATSGATESSREEAAARSLVPEPPSGSVPGNESIAPEAPRPDPKAPSDGRPASSSLEQLDLSWPSGNTAQRAETKPASASTASPPGASSTPATTGLRHAGQEQSAGERDRVHSREAHGRTEAGRTSSGGERTQRGGAAQQRQMNQTRRGQ